MKRRTRLLLGSLSFFLLTLGIFATVLFSTRIVVTENDVLVLERKTVYNEGASCTSTLRLYDSGKLLIDGCSTRSRLVSTESMAAFRQAITDTDILQKACRSESHLLIDEVQDFSQKTTLVADGKTKFISFPYCEAELKTILSPLVEYIQP